MNRQTKIAIHGAYYDNNFGDLLLLKIFDNWARAAISPQVVYPLVPKAEQTRFKKYFPEAQFSLGQHQSWQALIYGGGGHFGEPDVSSSQGYKGYRNWSLRFFARHVLPAELCLNKGIPYAIVGVGAGPLSNILVRQEVKRIFNNASLVSVRDIESQQFLQDELGIAQVKVVPDAALTIAKTDIPSRAVDKINSLLGSYAQASLLGIHHPRYILADTPQAEAMREGLLAALAAASDITPVVFADDGGGKYSEPCDRLAELIRNSTGKPCLSIPFKGVWETIALISKFSAVLTTKLHVGILAYAMGVYGESFAIHPKVARFYRQIGRSSQCTMFKELEKDICQEKAERALQAAHTQDSIIDDKWQKVRTEALLNQKLVSSFLDSTINISQAA